MFRRHAHEELGPFPQIIRFRKRAELPESEAVPTERIPLPRFSQLQGLGPIVTTQAVVSMWAKGLNGLSGLDRKDGYWRHQSSFVPSSSWDTKYNPGQEESRTWPRSHSH